MKKILHKISLLFGLCFLVIGTAKSQNGELILTTPDLSTWTCEIGEVQTFIWKYNYTIDGFDKQCDDISPTSVELSIGDTADVEIEGGPSVAGCFVSLNFICLTDNPLDLKICVNALDPFQANGVDNTSADDDGVGCFEHSINTANEEDSGNEGEDTDNSEEEDSETNEEDLDDAEDAEDLDNDHEDADNDGVPESEDCAPNDPNASSRYDACDDGNASTINDQYDSNCNCRGRATDTDNDGVPDSEDCAPNDPNASSRYDACDDGNASTINDQYDSNCNCRGREADTDNDGVPDSEDCAPNDPNASSRFDACDDGNANTINDQYDSNCNCRGKTTGGADSDGDGVPDSEDCAPDDPNASSRFDACDDGDASTVNDQYDSNCNCRGRGADTDGDGVPDSRDCAPDDPNASSRFDACDDKDVNTVNDQYDSNCNCRGQAADSDGDGVPDSEDCAPNNPNASSRFDACDDGNANTVNDRYDSQCRCRGDEKPTEPTVGSSESVVLFDLDACFSRVGSAEHDYSELEASYPNTLDCATFTSSTLFRDNPAINGHSCTPGAEGSNALCVSSRTKCSYSRSDDKTLIFEVQVDSDNPVFITGLKFLEKAPERYDWIDGASGENNYPTKYGLIINVDGEEVYFKNNIATTHEWTEESFSFDDIVVQASSIVRIELLPYCTVGNESPVSAWDIENLELFAACGEIGSSALVSTNSDVSSIDIKPTNEFANSYKAINVYPNPFTENVFFEFDLDSAEDVKIEIYDLNGRLINSYTNRLSKGKNVVEMNELQYVNLTSILISRISIGDTVYTKRIIKM